jgi:hypothetical protein
MNRPSAALFASFAWIVSVAGATQSAVAQCALSAVPSGGVPGVDGTVHATAMHDPDGPGPASPQLVFGGQFAVVGTQRIDDLAAWDPATGAVTPLGGTNGEVRALVSLGNGILIAAGAFSAVGGVAASNIAQWNGSAWSPLGAGCNGEVRVLAALPNGDVVAGGAFVAAGGAPASGVARWDGSAWSPLGAGIGVDVNALAVLPSGEVVAAGESVFSGGIQGCPVARWNGVTWLPLGASLQSGLGARVAALVAMPGGDVIAGGSFRSAGSGTSYLAQWSAATNTWSGLGGGYEVHSLRLVGSIVLIGQAWLFGSLGRISYLSGSFVSHLSYTNRYALAFDELPNGDLIAAGSFTYVDGNGGALGTPATGLARATPGGTGWGPLIAMPGAAKLKAVAADENGDVCAAGDFDVGGPQYSFRPTVARWTGSAWAPFAALGGPVACMTRMPNGDVVVGIHTYPPFSGPGVQRWNGSSWSQIPSFPGASGGTPLALAALPNGDLVASFDTTVRRLDVSQWQWLPMGTPLGHVRSFVNLPNGDLVAAASGVSGGVGPAVHRWDGSTWLPVGGPSNAEIHALARLPNGDLVAGGEFSMIGGVSANRVARWDGTSWSPLGSGVNGIVLTLASAPNGDLLVGGEFTLAGGLPADRWARWNGSSWLPMPATNGRVASLAMTANGTLFAAGDFSVVGGQLATSWSRVVTPCPATVAVAGTGCVGSGGANVLIAAAPPWLGATFTSTSTGLPSNGLAVRVHGFTASVTQLAAILPQSATGCLLLASPDLLDAHATGAGTLTTTLSLPNTVALANRLLHQQIVALETDAFGNITAATSTNALVLTLGAF